MTQERGGPLFPLRNLLFLEDNSEMMDDWAENLIVTKGYKNRSFSLVWKVSGPVKSERCDELPQLAWGPMSLDARIDQKLINTHRDWIPVLGHKGGIGDIYIFEKRLSHSRIKMFRITTQKSCLDQENIVVSLKLFLHFFSTGVSDTETNKIRLIRRQYSTEAAETLERQNNWCSKCWNYEI